MVGINMKINGKRVTSSQQLEREMNKSIEKSIAQGIRKAAGHGVKIKKTRNGIVAEGTPEQLNRMKPRLR